jgi:MOSC domain-containing protein YiiM
MEHRSAEELAAGPDVARSSPANGGVLELIVRRPFEGAREVLVEGELTAETGLAGDRWASSGGGANRDVQVTLMNARVADLVAGSRERWPLAGDQLYVDLDLTPDNLPVGSRLAVGGAVLEITAEPHTGCAKFGARFGSEALKLVNQPPGRALRLRGANARVIQDGIVRQGDRVSKLA